jgi:hypothetical protein
LTAVLATGPNDGTLALNADGSFTYTPDPDFNGTDAFTYVANDGGEVDSNTATVTIAVNPVNDPPVAFPKEVNVLQNSGETLIAETFFLDEDPPASDPDGDALTFIGAGPVDDPVGGCVTAGTVTYYPETDLVGYEPGVNYTGIDCFAYTIADTSLATATASVTVNVIDDVPDYGFLGLLDPWRPNYKMNPTSAFPIKWYYTDPVTNDPVPSEDALPEIRIKGPFVCCPHLVCDETPDTVEVINYPGSSDYQYDPLTYLQQFNWDTVGLLSGCYDIRIFSEQTSQINGPFRVQLK